MSADFSGNWKMDRTEGGAEFIAAVGIPADKAAKDVKVEIIQNANDFTFKVVTEKGNRDHTVTVGKPFKETIMGFEVEGAAKWDGDKLVTSNDKGSKIVREIIDGELVVSVTIKGVTVKRFFKKC